MDSGLKGNSLSSLCCFPTSFACEIRVRPDRSRQQWSQLEAGREALRLLCQFKLSGVQESKLTAFVSEGGPFGKGRISEIAKDKGKEVAHPGGLDPTSGDLLFLTQLNRSHRTLQESVLW